MIAKLAPVLILVAAVALGAAGGYAARTQLGAEAAEVSDASDAPEHDSHGAKKGHKKGGHDAAEAPTYLKFGRQFVVPLDAERNVRALMILDVNIEVEAETSEAAYALEPKLRDACLAALLELAGRGELAPIASSPEALAKAKERLLAAANSVLGDGALAVLITDIGVQPM